MDLNKFQKKTTKTKSSVQSLKIGRLYIIFTIFLFFGSILSYRLVNLCFDDRYNWKKIANSQHQTEISIQGIRGQISDRNGKVLAISNEVFDLGCHPESIQDKNGFYNQLSDLYSNHGRTIPSDAYDKINSSKKYVNLDKSLNEDLAKEIKVKLASLVEISPEYKRVYPHSNLALDIIGRVGTDGDGISGFELSFNDRLKGSKTTLSSGRDAKGRLITKSDNSTIIAMINPSSSSMELDNIEESKNGESINLSLDLRIQEIIEEEFQKGLIESRASNVFGIIVDAHTGEVLSMSNKSNTDVTDPIALLKNKVIQDNFEPGSTLKPIIAAIALQYGVISPSEKIDCENGKWRVKSAIINDVHPIGIANIRDILVRSSNICMSKIGLRIGKNRLGQSLSDLGFGGKSGLELPGEAVGIFRNFKNWGDVDVATHSFGQGVAVTPLQMVRAYSALANGGYLNNLTLIKQDRVEINRVTQPIKNGKKVFDKDVSKLISEFIFGVTEDEHGTGQKGAISGLRVSAKTGTAEKPINGKYVPDKVIASFIGYIDASNIGINRTFVMFVGVDEPKVVPRYGGVVAAPIFKRSMERVISMYLASNEN